MSEQSNRKSHQESKYKRVMERQAVGVCKTDEEQAVDAGVILGKQTQAVMAATETEQQSRLSTRPSSRERRAEPTRGHQVGYERQQLKQTIRSMLSCKGLQSTRLSSRPSSKCKGQNAIKKCLIDSRLARRRRPLSKPPSRCCNWIGSMQRCRSETPNLHGQSYAHLRSVENSTLLKIQQFMNHRCYLRSINLC